MTGALADGRRRPEETRVPGGAAKHGAVLVVDLSDEQASAPRVVLGRRRPALPERRRMELQILHDPHLRQERLEPVREGYLALEDEPEQHEAEIAVDRFRAGW